MKRLLQCICTEVVQLIDHESFVSCGILTRFCAYLRLQRGGVMMKWIIALMMACSVNVMAQSHWQPQPKSPSVVFTPVASKCDVSACQQNCYVQQSQCKNDSGGGCGSLAQICVQNCASQCR
jgi:hypothetical protein